MFKKFLFISLIFFLVSCSKQEKIINAGIEMQNFVSNISKYCRSIKQDFIVIPQNGEELVFKNVNPLEEIEEKYINAIDALTVEALFFFGNYVPDNYRIEILRKIVKTKPIFVSEYVDNKSDIAGAYEINQNEGFVCFVRDKENYYYENIPDTIINENNLNIEKISNAKNFLYLIGSKFTDKEKYLNSIASTNYDLVLIDLFFNDKQLNQSDLDKIRYKANGGKGY